MKNKDIAYGGLMIATFLGISLIFRGNARVVQTYVEIVKTIVVAVFLRNIKNDKWWIFAVSCFISSLFFVSIPETLIYNVPSIVGGCVIGLQRHKERIIRNYLIYFVVHSVMLIYEIFMFSILMQTNLFVMYSEQFSDVLAILTNGVVTTKFMQIFVVVFTIFDSAFSSFVIFALSQMTVRKLERAIKTTDVL